MRRSTTRILFLSLALAAGLGAGPVRSQEPGSPPVSSPAGERDRIVLLDAEGTAYRRLDIPDSFRRHPEAGLRLVVLRHGVPVADLGLRETRTTTSLEEEGRPGWMRERGLVENAYIATDGRSAAVVRNEYELLRDPEGRDRIVDNASTLTWLDTGNPEGRWTLDLDDGRMIRLAYPLSGERGLVVMASRAGEFSGDLSVYGPDGGRFVHFGALEGTPREIRPTVHDAFVAIELAFPSRAGFPDQGIVVVDLLRRTHWTYAWRYGTDREPVSWGIADSGILTVTFADHEERYDRFGRALPERGGKRRRK